MKKILKQNNTINIKDISHISISDDKNEEEECNIIDIDNNGSIVMRKTHSGTYSKSSSDV